MFVVVVEDLRCINFHFLGSIVLAKPLLRVLFFLRLRPLKLLSLFLLPFNFSLEVETLLNRFFKLSLL